jgi:hypothetical protein
MHRLTPKGSVALRALLHSLIDRQLDAVARRLSDRLGEFGEGGGDSQQVWGFGG